MSWEKICDELMEYGLSLGFTEEEIREIFEENKELLDWIQKK
ncbi:hypothetical protein P5609_001325 [Bacillus licheniformis]|nr:hypothetical protein [Bacillus licheniformis]MDH3162330.1 hypothetical protein [Bacillus licheniformis]MED4409016.1 hypothetical protein [Bacillus licheniformis]